MLFETRSSGNYVLIVYNYAEAKMWSEANSMKKVLEYHGLQKFPAAAGLK